MQVSFAIQVQSEVVSYEGNQVWRITLRGPKDIQLIKKLVDNEDISIWSLTPKRADFLVQPDERLEVNRLLKSQGLNHTVMIMDVQRRADTQRARPMIWNDETLRAGHRLNWDEYPTLRIIEEYFDYLTETFSSVCEVTTIGYTAENRTIKMVKVSNGNPENKVIVVSSGMHAREWIAVTSALFILNTIVTDFDRLPRYMKNKDWIIIPLLNPDGYEYSQTHDRLWRKNRRQLRTCIGVDINRNFGTFWDIKGITATNECYEAYSGPRPFSEAESVALRNVILNSEKRPDALIDLHSYGKLILYPWSAKYGTVPDRSLHEITVEHMKRAIYNATSQYYKSGVAYHMIYPATGTAIDWVYYSGVQQTFAIETGGDDLHGFLIPEEHIQESANEILAAVKNLAKSFEPYLTPKESWF